MLGATARRWDKESTTEATQWDLLVIGENIEVWKTAKQTSKHFFGGGVEGGIGKIF